MTSSFDLILPINALLMPNCIGDVIPNLFHHFSEPFE